jgi:hypothetical protein
LDGLSACSDGQREEKCGDVYAYVVTIHLFHLLPYKPLQITLNVTIQNAAIVVEIWAAIEDRA